MKKLTDEQLQSLLDDGHGFNTGNLPAPDRQQLEDYRSLFQKLKQEPPEGLPYNFASKVSTQLKLKLKRQSDIRFNLFALLGIVAGLLTIYGMLTLMDNTAAQTFLQAVLRFKWMLMLGVCTLLGALVFEQRVVEEQ